MKRVIGITGGIASGKSQVSNYIKSKSYTLYDSDTISHSVFELESTKKELSNTFNIDIQDVTRSNIGKLVFNDRDKLQKLNNIMQPLIQERMKKIIEESNDLIFFDIPLLYDLKLEYMVDKIIYVYVREDIQLERLIKRDNISKFYAINKIASQLSMGEKLKIAKDRNDYIVDNNQTLDKLYNEVDKVLKEITHDI